MHKISEFDLALEQLTRADIDWELNLKPTLKAILKLAGKLEDSIDSNLFYQIFNEFVKKLPNPEKVNSNGNLLHELRKILNNKDQQIAGFSETDQRLLIQLIEEYKLLKSQNDVKEFVKILEQKMDATELKFIEFKKIEEHIQSIKELLKNIIKNEG